jgi:LacI family transcriptional regulator, galactose operon repressor
MGTVILRRIAAATILYFVRIALAMGLEDYYEHGVARGIVRFARERGDWRLYGQGWMFSSLKDLATFRGDGVIARIESAEAADFLASLGLPLVDVANAYTRRSFRCVSNDDIRTGAAAGRFLRSLGFRRFAFAGVEGTLWSGERFQGFRRIVGEPIGVFLRSLDWYESREAETELQDFLRVLPKPAALFACNDTVGLRVINACRISAVVVPDQLAVLGVDNEDIPCELARPPLSSIELGLEEIGYRAAALLQHRIEGRDPGAVPRIPPGMVIERESTRVFAFDDPLVVEAMRLIRTEGRRLRSVTELSERLNASRRTLEVHFKRETGRTLHEALVKSRLDFACGMLKEGDVKVTAVAAASGFSSAQRFFAVFREQFGQTPLEYRRVQADTLSGESEE